MVALHRGDAHLRHDGGYAGHNGAIVVGHGLIARDGDLAALAQVADALVRRMRVSRDIGQYKKEHNMPILQAKRYEDLLARRAEQAVQLGMDREFMRSVLQAIHEESIRQQMQVLGE